MGHCLWSSATVPPIMLVKQCHKAINHPPDHHFFRWYGYHSHSWVEEKYPPILGMKIYSNSQICQRWPGSKLVQTQCCSQVSIVILNQTVSIQLDNTQFLHYILCVHTHSSVQCVALLIHVVHIVIMGKVTAASEHPQI